jgi:molybdopterin-guanine dinucleotide biosynthesis protein A
METGDEETTDTGIDHNVGITSDNVALNVSAAILVGGAARRLGGIVKPSLIVAGARIIDRQVAALQEAGVADIALVGRWLERNVPGVHHLPDMIEGAGALGGLYGALITASFDVVVVLAGDMPFVTAPWLRSLTEVGRFDAKVVRLEGRWHPLCAGYRRQIAAGLKARIDRGDLRVTDALDDVAVREVTAAEVAEFDTTGMLLMNVNTPDDYCEAERLARLRT